MPLSTEHERQPTILLVDDDTTALETYANFLQASGYRVLTAVDAPTGLALAEGNRPMPWCSILPDQQEGLNVLASEPAASTRLPSRS